MVDGLAVEYQDEGTGMVLLFLHGWMDTLHTFDGLARILAPHYRIVRLDLPGFGESEMPKETWDLDKYAHFVDDFIYKLNLEVDVIVGHSFGGRVIIKGVSMGTLRPRKIILIGSAGIAQRNTARNFFFNIVAKIGRVITSIPPLHFWKEKIRKRFYRRIGSDYASAGVLRETFLKTISEDLSENAKKVEVPALLIWGSDDTETPLSDGERLARLIPDVKLEVLQGAGHFVHREKPEGVAQLIKDFVC